MTWLLVLSLAHAAPGAHYDPATLPRESELFRRAQAALLDPFQERQGDARDLAAALRAYEEALDLLGDRAPADQRARYATLSRAFERQRAAISRVASEVVERSGAAFEAALDRAIAGRDITPCQATGGLRGLPGVGASRADCPGDDLTATLAAAMDRDPALRGDVEALLATAWPDFDLPVAPQAAVGDGVALDVGALLRRGAPGALAAVEHEDREARLPFAAAIEQGASAEELAALKDDAAAVTARTASWRAGIAAPVLATAEKLAARLARRGFPGVAWCAQPALLGGCTAPAASAAQVTDHPKVTRALARADRWRP